jgi:ABC-type multidrug transport system fused ATPase/permease subunit
LARPRLVICQGRNILDNQFAGSTFLPTNKPTKWADVHQSFSGRNFKEWYTLCGSMGILSRNGSPMTQITIQLEKVCKDGDGQVVHALRNIDLSVQQGERLALTGSTDSEKSSLLNLICGLDNLTSGTTGIAGMCPITEVVPLLLNQPGNDVDPW